ncbi:hypothetical protein DB42_AC00540 [Neochlamydia sp. EPS4]|nr:hypothetical protein DB42_AC00540 [Neochlamydia sp. EPS4]
MRDFIKLLILKKINFPRARTKAKKFLKKIIGRLIEKPFQVSTT